MVRVHLSTLLGTKRWSVKYLSDLTGIRYNTLLDLYNELAISIKFEHVDLICKALGCKFDELLEHVPDNK
jgi:putative transcriptional regulator